MRDRHDEAVGPGHATAACRARSRQPALDHAIRALDRATARSAAARSPAAITYFGFLSFFPLLALAFAARRLHQRHGSRTPRPTITDALEDAFPGLIGPGPGPDQRSATSSTPGPAPGSSALLGLLYAGLGWVDALRIGLRRVFGTLDVAAAVRQEEARRRRGAACCSARAVLASLVVSSLATRRHAVRPGPGRARRLPRRRRAAQGAGGRRWPCSPTPCCSRSCSPGCRAPTCRGARCARAPARGGRLRGAQAGRDVPHRARRPRTRSTRRSAWWSGCWSGSTSCPGC